MATAVDLAGLDQPADKTPPEGLSLAPLFAGEPLAGRLLFWEHEGNRAVRDGDWKLVAEHGKPWELYNLARDRSEQHDLATAEPNRAARMAAAWEAYARRALVEPWDRVR